MSITGGDPSGVICFSQANYAGGYVSITFDSVVNYGGNLPLMTGTTSSLQGLRYISIVQSTAGNAPIGGTFRLSFRGAVTEDISADHTSGSIASAISTALGQLSTITSGGVTVSSLDITADSNFAYLYKVAFTDADLGGDVEAIQVVDSYNLLTGKDVAIYVYTDGTEATTFSDTYTAFSGGYVSQRGNEIGGSFSLTYRGHTTEAIDFNAADTVVKARLEALDNIGTVTVVRTGPSVWKEYVWTVTFNSMPGLYPYGSGDVLELTSDTTDLTGQTTLDISTTQEGSTPLGGTYTLAVTRLICHFDRNNDHDSKHSCRCVCEELEEVLNALGNVGTVTVIRTDEADGYSWLVTFDGCKIDSGADVCTQGDVAVMVADNTNMDSCASSDDVTVTTVDEGSGPGTCSGTDTNLCEDYVTDLSGAAPYSYLITGLNAGTNYYVRVAAHNSQGYGYASITNPE